MSDDFSQTFYNALYSEHAKLKEELRQNRDFRIYLALDNILNSYEQNAVLKQPRKLLRNHRSGSEYTDIINKAQNYLRTIGKRAQTKQITTNINDQNEQYSLSRVASTLSASPLFDNVRGEGYGLVEWQTQKDE